MDSEDNTNYVNQMKNKNTTKLDYNENHFDELNAVKTNHYCISLIITIINESNNLNSTIT